MENDIQLGEWLVQPMLNSISGNGKIARVEPKAMQVLAYLAEHAGDVMPKERILQAVWADTFVTDDVLTRAISELRKAFNDDPQNPQFIQTIPKRGYRLIAPAEKVGEPIGAVRELPQQRRQLALFALSAITLLTLAAYFVRQRFWHKAQPLTTKIRLVVLPFDNLSGDPAQEYFSDGITEEMTAQLSRLQPEQLAVIGRSSAMAYKGAKKTIDQIGKELGVQYVLEGSVRQAGDRVRITAQLIEVENQTHVWAEEYDRDLRDILGVQAEVAQKVARETQLKLTPEQQARTASPRPVSPEAHEVNPEAYRQYLLGRKYWNERTPAGITKGIACFRLAIHDDPNFAPAYAGLADSLLFNDRSEATAEAKDAARKAIAIDPTLGEPHASLGFIALIRDWDWLESEKEFRRAIQLSPNDATAHHWFAFHYEETGQLQDAIRELNRALEIDPLSPIIRSALAEDLSETGEHDKALEEIRKVLETDPGFGKGHLTLAHIFVRKRMFPDAIEELKKAGDLGVNRQEVIMDLGYAHALAGDSGEAEKTIRDLERRAKLAGEPPPADYIAMIYVGLRNRDQAFAWLEKAREQRGELMLDLKVNHAFDPLRSDPRFQDLLRRMNFPP